MKTSMTDCYYYKIYTKVTTKKKEIGFGEFEVDKELRATVNFLFQKFNTNASFMILFKIRLKGFLLLYISISYNHKYQLMR